MKKTLLSIALWALLAPFAFAAYNDVTLTTSAVINVSGGTMTVSGSSAVVESIVVGASSFNVTLLSGSSITVSAAGNKNMDLVVPSPITSTLTCDSSGSSTLALSGATGSVTVTVTPSGTCGASSSSGSGSSLGGGIIQVSGGGGGSYVSPMPPPVTTTPTAPVSMRSFLVDFGMGATGADVVGLQTLLEAKGFLTIPAGVAKGTFGALTKKALQAYQTSLGINATGYVGPLTRASLNSMVSATAPASTSTSGVTGALSGEFGIGATGPDVVTLQTFLEGKGLLVMPAGVAKGTFGALTKKALQAYQTSLGINATGYVGPKTLVAVNAGK